MSALRVATWNIHGAVGLDRRCDPARIAHVLVELGADVVALQEVWWARGRTAELCALLADATGSACVFARTFDKRGQPFGNALLCRVPIVSHDIVDLAVGRREPRNAIVATLQVGDGLPCVLATHLGLAAIERRIQCERLSRHLHAEATPCIVLGDLNEWRKVGALSALGLASGRAAPTFPSALPLAPFDRILAQPPSIVHERHVHATRAARIASDHLPLVATIDLPGSWTP